MFNFKSLVSTNSMQAMNEIHGLNGASAFAARLPSGILAPIALLIRTVEVVGLCVN